MKESAVKQTTDPKQKSSTRLIIRLDEKITAILISSLYLVTIYGIYETFFKSTYLDYISSRILYVILGLLVALSISLYKSQKPTTTQGPMIDLQSFFAGMQAFAAFLQVWQTERNAAMASAAYYEAKGTAMRDPETADKAMRLSFRLKENPTLNALLENRFGRCTDALEAALRTQNEEMLNEASRAFVKCRCLILQAIKTADGSLDPDLQKEWDKHNCEIALGLKKH